MTKELPAVSLIICTYNREDLLVETIKCALDQDYPQLEIVVIDQTEKHHPDTTRFFESISNRVSYVFLETPSITKARNLGLQTATGDVLIFVDDDTSFAPQFVAEHVKTHLLGNDVVQGRVIERDDPLRDDARPQWMAWYLKVKGTNNCIIEGATNTITGCNFSVSRRAVDLVGHFDERFTGIAVREDSDYGIRCHRAGLKMVFAPEAAVHHHRSDTGGVGSGIDNHFFTESYYYNEMLFAWKHFNPLVCFYYRLRLRLRGNKALRRVIHKACKAANRIT